MSVDQSTAMADAVVGADFTPGSQDPSNAAAHAMCNAGSMSSCTADTEKFVDAQWAAKSPQGLANLLHFDQDSFASGHAGGQPWTGSIFDGPGNPLTNAWNHITGDLMPSDSLQGIIVQRSAVIIRAYNLNCGGCIQNWSVPKSELSSGD